MYLSLNHYYFQPKGGEPDPVLDAGKGLSFRYGQDIPAEQEYLHQKEESK